MRSTGMIVAALMGLNCTAAVGEGRDAGASDAGWSDASQGPPDAGQYDAGDLDAGARCWALAQTWLDAMHALDRSCAAASDCILPADCDCRAPAHYNALGGSLYQPVNKNAYQNSSAPGLTEQWMTECMLVGPELEDCGARQLACVNGTCAIASQDCCMCPWSDAGL